MAVLALTWGLIAASAVFIGAALGWLTRPSARVLAGLMAFGSGVLLSVVAYEIVNDAYEDGGLGATMAGYVIGAVLFTAGLFWLDRAGARHRKRSNMAVGAGRQAGGVVALATMLDALPESLIIGVNFYNGEMVALATVAAVFLSNIPESLSATTRMRLAGHGAGYVVGVWVGVAIVGALATFGGFLLLRDLSAGEVAFVQAIGGGALLVFVVDTMIPEAFAETHELAGLIAALGFLAGFALALGLG
jgi:ZIP family zinc transporter